MDGENSDPRVWNVDSTGDLATFIAFAASADSSRDLVKKIVIGPPLADLDIDNDWSDVSLGILSNVDWSSFPNLSHLYLWSIGALERLGPLPRKLKCLDLRECRRLASLPSSLPGSLQTLDLGGCEAIEALPSRLPAGLEELFLDGCSGLKQFAPVERLLGFGESAQRGSARKKRCRMRRMELHGCRFDDLDETFCGEQRENVLPRILEKLREEAEQGSVFLPECKIIVLGSGGAGKTSLVRALKGLPFRDERKTERIRLWTWDGGDGFRPYVEHPDLSARINIWDFGGQELYHNTHRMFLETRALFVVVWRQPPRDGSPSRPELPNEPDFDLNYWLDQILIPQPRARVMIVRTRMDEDGSNPPADWRPTVREQYRKLESFAVSALDEERASLDPLRTQIQKAIRGELKREDASRVPKRWLDVRNAISRWQPVPPDDDSPPVQSHHPVLRWHEFEKLVREADRRPHENKAHGMHREVETASLSLARYLHDIGAVFFPRVWQEETAGLVRLPVVVDQAWAMQGIYHLETSPAVRAEMQRSTGQLTRATLDLLWARAGHDLAAGNRPFTPEHIWVFEQVMQAAGIMIDISDPRQGVRRFLFPDFLPDRAAVAEWVPWPKSNHVATYLIIEEGRKAFGKDFACRLVGMLRRESERGSVRSFRFGGFVPLVVAHSTIPPDGNGPESSETNNHPECIAAIEWLAPERSAAVGYLTLTVNGAPQSHHGAIRHVMNLLERDPGLRLTKPRIIEAEGREGLSSLRYPRDTFDRPLRGKTVDITSPPDPAEPPQMAPQQQVVIAISYAGDPDAGVAGAREVGIEFIPDRVYSLLKDKLSPAECQIIMYKEQCGIGTLQELIDQIAHSAIVVAVVTMRYVESAYCLEEYTRSALHLSDPRDFGEVFKGAPYPFRKRLVTCQAEDEVLNFEIGAWLERWTTECNRAFDALKAEFGASRGRLFFEAKLRDRRQDADWLIRVQDHGEGIEKVPAAIRSHRFEPWVRHGRASNDKRAEILADHIVELVRDIQRTRSMSISDEEVSERLRKIAHDFIADRHDEAADAYSKLIMARDVRQTVARLLPTLGLTGRVIDEIADFAKTGRLQMWRSF